MHKKSLPEQSGSGPSRRIRLLEKFPIDKGSTTTQGKRVYINMSFVNSGAVGTLKFLEVHFFRAATTLERTHSVRKKSLGLPHESDEGNASISLCLVGIFLFVQAWLYKHKTHTCQGYITPHICYRSLSYRTKMHCGR